VTYEFENVPVSAALHLEQSVPVFPPPKALEVAQDRLVEKRFLNACGIPTAEFRAVDSDADLAEALEAIGYKGVLKTRRFGYAGKGQKVYRSREDSPEGGFAELGGGPLILESFVPFVREVSVIAARARDGRIAAYDPVENVHRDGILHTSTLPASIGEETARAAREAAEKLLAALNYVGVVGMEFFVLEDGTLVANEIAPRVHNSGHWTEAACIVSQFEQHIRAIAGLPLGNPIRHSDCIMQNLIGDDIAAVPEWLARDEALVHLYGKTEARPGRKMGHVTWLTGKAR
jgi:5-(carboxyamino)imidazole ribonucleotide synthase